MSTYTVHIKRSGVQGGWAATVDVEADSFAEAAVKAVTAHNQDHGLDLANIPHTAEFVERPNRDTIRFEGDPDVYQDVVFRWAEPHRVFDPLVFGGWGMAQPGDYWFSHRVREGKPGDCHVCGGTGVDAYNPFKRCRVCSDGADRIPVAGIRQPEGETVSVADLIERVPDFVPGHEPEWRRRP